MGGEGRGEESTSIRRGEKKEKEKGGGGVAGGNPFKPSIFNPQKGACFGGGGEAWCQPLLYDFVLWLFNDFSLVSYFFLIGKLHPMGFEPKISPSSHSCGRRKCRLI